MVSEKMAAFKSAGLSASASGHMLRSAMGQQAAVMGKLAGQGWLSPLEWWELLERNALIATGLASLPGEILAPCHTAATANAKRLATG